MGRPVQTRANMMKLISTLALVAVASAQYAPAPVVKVVKEIPQPYAYEYGVAADHTNGFVAEVTYSGEAVYPPAPAGGYPGEAHAYAAPAYAAPVYHAPAPAYPA